MSAIASQITGSRLSLKRLFRRRSKKTSKLRGTGLCEGHSPVTGEFPAQRVSNAENESIWWRHHVLNHYRCLMVIIVHALELHTENSWNILFTFRLISVLVLHPVVYPELQGPSVDRRWLGTLILTHWGWLTHICPSKLTIISSEPMLGYC